VTLRNATWKRGVTLVGLSLCFAQSVPDAASAQSSAATRPLSIGDGISVYLLTIGQGDQVWERFGHNAIGIRDQRTKSDIVFNWGLFDFAQPGFIPHFIRGEMVYWMGGFDAGPSIVEYITRNRAVTIQELNLTPNQRVALVEFIQWNARDANKFYRYDYFRDNCSTRVRDALDRVLHGAIRRATEPIITAESYRDMSLRLMAEDPLTATGMDIGLGLPADRRITAWEEMFIPMRLRDRLRNIQVTDPRGQLVPLVSGERIVFEPKRAPEAIRPPDRRGLFLLIGTFLGGLILIVSRVPAARSRPRDGVTRVAVVVWSLVVGVLGGLLTFLWLGTRHVYAYENLNLLQYNPLWLGLALLVPFVVRGSGVSRWAVRLATIVAGLTILGIVVACIPPLRQHSLAVLLLAAPPNLATALAVRRLLSPLSMGS
jgi:uncharacterized protein DUF4105